MHTTSQQIRYAYVNPVLLQVIREAFYTSTTSIVRRTHLLYKKYPSLTYDARLFGFNWRGAFPVNIYVLGAVAVSPFSIYQQQFF
jgi:hypothetical protein